MFLNKLFSSKNKKEEANLVNNQTSTEIKKGIWYFAKKIWIILWISAALQSNPVIAENNDYQKEEISQEVPTHQKEKEIKKIKLAKAISWDSVEGFMIRSFWVSTWWDLLVWKDWSRIKNPKTDLIAWKEYILARDEKEAKILVKMFSRKTESISQPISSELQKNQDLPIQEENKFTPLEEISNYNKIPENPYNITYANVWPWSFDYNAYIRAISAIESNGNYKASNAKKWEKYWVNSQKYAKWRYQFTKETLAWFWIKTDQQIQKYLKSPELQDEIMRKFTLRNYQYAIKTPSISLLLNKWINISQILATMHHRGSYGAELIANYAIKQENPVQAFYQRLAQVKWDWLGTKTSDYIDSVWKRYAQLAQTNYSNDILVNRQAQPDKRMVSIIASNDDDFSSLTQAPWVSVEVSKVSMWYVEKVELIDQTPKVDVSVVVKQHYKTQLLLKLSKMNFSNLSEDSKTKLIDKLSKVDDLEAYYKDQIDYHKNIILTSVNDLEIQKSKKILVWLERLLDDTKKIISASNNEYSNLKKAA